MYRRLFLLLFLACLPAALMAVPRQINYQGFLTRPNGTALDTTVVMTFRLYDGPGASAVQRWNEIRPAVTVQAGLFNVLLGAVQPLPDSVFATDSLYLGVTIGNNAEMNPRTALSSAAYAYRVGTVDGATGGVLSGTLNVGQDNLNAAEFANVLGESNQVLGHHSGVGGGSGNRVDGFNAVIAGGGSNYSNAAYSVIAGGQQDSIFGNYGVIGGGLNNWIGATGSAVIAGGQNNRIVQGASFIGGGGYNEVTAIYGVVAGGENNEAGDRAFVGGGYFNNATGSYSTIPGGTFNAASGRYSLAAGRYARADHTGAFVWGDSTNAIFSSAAANTFNVRASNGFRFYTNAAATVGVTLTAGDNTWNSVCDSTLKTRLGRVDGGDLLAQLADLPIYRWHHRDGDPSLQHIGPMAQDFWNQFHLGADSLKISTIDPSGIALAAIQELNRENQRLREQNMTLERRLQRVESLLSGLASGE